MLSHSALEPFQAQLIKIAMRRFPVSHLVFAAISAEGTNGGVIAGSDKGRDATVFQFLPVLGGPKPEILRKTCASAAAS